MTGSPEDPFAPGSPRVRDANRLCTELLAESVKPLEASHAFVYAVTDREQLVIVAETAGEWSGGIRAQKRGPGPGGTSAPTWLPWRHCDLASGS